MTDKRALLPWVEAQDQPRRGGEENENGALGAELSTPHSQKAPDNTTTASRILNVICPHPGKKVDTFNTQLHTDNNITRTAYDRIYQPEATTERPGPAPCGASQRKSASLTLDAARRKGSPQSYRAFGHKRPLNQRPIETKNNYKTKKKLVDSPKHTELSAPSCVAHA